MKGDYDNVLDRCFGPDPNPDGKLPTLPYNYSGTAAGGLAPAHEHVWVTGERHGVPFWECHGGCAAMRSEPPP